jgi:hypothetical protein
MHPCPTLSLHAIERSRTRRIPEDAILAVMEFGKHRSIRGADVYTLGWREVRRHAGACAGLDRWEGIEVVCAHDGQVVTVYRNRNPRALRDRAGRRLAA